MKIAEIEIVLCCPKCVEILQFKQRIGKYKPLTQPAKCVRCEQRKVLNAYHASCRECALKLSECAKCHVKIEHEIAKDESKESKAVEEQVKGLSERLRRTYLRKLKEHKFEDAQKILDSQIEGGDEWNEEDDSEDDSESGNSENNHDDLIK